MITLRAFLPMCNARSGLAGQCVHVEDVSSDAAQLVCARFGSQYVATLPDSIAGVGDGLTAGAFPLNGLRHSIGSTSGWFLWAGEELLSDPDFFKPLHVSHLRDRCPEVLPYLGLAPGHRFLIAPGHEDVWFDPQLLEHEV